MVQRAGTRDSGGVGRRGVVPRRRARRRWPKRDLGAVLTRVWLRSDVRDVTNPNTGSVWGARRAEAVDHGKAALHAAEARRWVAFRPLERVIGYNYWSNRERMERRSSPRTRGGRGCSTERRRRSPAAACAAEFVVRVLGWSSGSGTPRVVAWWCCGGIPGVREVRCSTTGSNCIGKLPTCSGGFQAKSGTGEDREWG